MKAGSIFRLTTLMLLRGIWGWWKPWRVSIWSLCLCPLYCCEMEFGNGEKCLCEDCDIVVFQAWFNVGSCWKPKSLSSQSLQRQSLPTWCLFYIFEVSYLCIQKSANVWQKLQVSTLSYTNLNICFIVWIKRPLKHIF